MKKIVLFFMMMLPLTVMGQKDVTTFLGIPVDGSKSSMIQKLKNKGFAYNQKEDCLTGEFNGSDVEIRVVTNNNKVWRIAVFDVNYLNETDIKIRFNKLCQQFNKNKKYLSSSLGDKDFIIPEDEDIFDQMLFNKKRYEASYFQAPDLSKVDTLSIQQRIKNELLHEYTQEEIDNPSEEQREKMKNFSQFFLAKIAFELVENKLVWFMIREKYGKYYIQLFYDNEYNHSNGEDL